LTVGHFSVNGQSRRVIEKCGFKPEGVVPWACKRFDGKICDDVCYSILREDYINGLGTNLQDQL
jgi:putative acetyltransferase